MKKNIIKYFLLSLSMLTVFSSCRKDEFVDDDAELKGSGVTIVKVSDGPQKSVFVDNQPGIGNVNVFNVRRDVPNNAVLNTSSTVTLTVAPELITAYNTANPVGGAPNTYEVLPASLFTAGDGLTAATNGYTLTFAPGEFSKDFKINLNFPLFDFSKKYALAFNVTATSEGKVTATNQNKIFAIVGVKNAWDGVYTCQAGTIQRYTAGALNQNDALNGDMAGNPAVSLVTINATTVQIVGLNWAKSGGAIGATDPITMIIDPATNLVSQVRSTASPTMAKIAGAENKYDPATKTFTLNFDWNQTANKREILGLKLAYRNSR